MNFGLDDVTFAFGFPVLPQSKLRTLANLSLRTTPFLLLVITLVGSSIARLNIEIVPVQFVKTYGSGGVAPLICRIGTI